ncbi:MAG: GPP34 family phosphoprotein [Bacteroidia bacterium]|nr:GPP34 family phosphoprotein [Bacteroidia bacterium]
MNKGAIAHNIKRQTIMKLNTIEKYLLLAQHPTKGRSIYGQYVNYGTIGAILLEVSLNDGVSIENKLLILKENIEFENPVLLDIANLIRSSEKPRKIKHWINKLVRKPRKYKWPFLNELENKKVIRIENKKFLGLFPYRKCYLIENAIRESLIQDIKTSILNNHELNNEEIVILGLVEACKMHKIISSEKKELKTIKRELKLILKENPIAGTVAKTIKDVQTAITIAIVTSTIAASSASSS